VFLGVKKRLERIATNLIGILRMRSVPLAVAILASVSTIFASEIREFNVPTLERLGNELIRQSQRRDRGAIDPVRKRARQTAIAALQGQLFKLRYDYVVLNDPDGKRFLVYALGKTSKADEVVLAGHLRVTVSPDGSKVERVDPLSKSALISSERESGLPVGFKMTALYFNQIVSNRPVETFIYLANLARKNIYVQTPDGKIWLIANGRMKVDTSKPSNKTEAGAAHKAFDR
jgi:hypothetical protein